MKISPNFFLTLNSRQFHKEVGGYNPNSGIFLGVARVYLAAAEKPASKVLI